MAQQVSAGEGTVTVGQSGETVTIGQSDGSVGFFGATPSAVAALTVIGALTAGETTPADIAAAVVELYDELVAKGLVG